MQAGRSFVLTLPGSRTVTLRPILLLLLELLVPGAAQAGAQEPAPAPQEARSTSEKVDSTSHQEAKSASRHEAGVPSRHEAGPNPGPEDGPVSRQEAAPLPQAPDSQPIGNGDLKRRREIRKRQLLIAAQKRADRIFDRLLQRLPERARRDSVPHLGLRVADHTARANALLAEAVGVAHPVWPFVYSVDPTSPADAAGLQPGDQVLAVAGEPLKDSKSFYKRTSRSDLSFPLALEVLRDGRRLDLELGAGYRPRGLEVEVLGDQGKIDAYADKRQISITMGLMNFLRDDSELAVVLGHEIAHVVRGHFSSSYLEGGFQPYFSQGLEIEADRYGLELAYRAGYDPAVGAEVWQRFESELPRTIADQWLLSHPPTRQRIASARRVAEELKAGAAGEKGDGPGDGGAIPH